MGVTTLAKAGNSDLEVVQYATLADRPTAANFGIGKNIVSNAAYTIESVSDGTEYYSQGHSASLADRPSAAAFGPGFWQVAGDVYSCDGSNWVTIASGITKIATPFDYMTPAQIADVQSGAEALDHEAAINNLINSDAKVIRFPSGVYRGGFSNFTSDRVFIFDSGAILDGVVHIAVGNGPDLVGGSQTISWVKNVRVIGELVSTVRVGTYYCDGVNIDKIRITAINASYVNQTAEGGSKGIHFYYGSHNIKVGEYIAESATGVGTYALGIDRLTTTDADHTPTDITFNKITIKGSTVVPLSIKNTLRTHIGDLVATCGGATNGLDLYNNTAMTIDKAYVDCANIAGTTAGVNNQTSDIHFGEVEVLNSANIGFYVVGGGVSAERVIAHNNAVNGVDLRAPCKIDYIKTYSNTGRGLNLPTGFTHDQTYIGHVESYSNGNANIEIKGATDVTIDSIYAHDNASVSGWGLYLDTCVRFRNNYLKAVSNVQGLRHIGSIESKFGFIDSSGSSSVDIALSGTNTDLQILKAKYTTISGTLETTPGYKSLPQAMRAITTNGDAATALTVGTSTQTQVFDSPLTADRAVSLSTAAKNGDRFRVVRTANATGAFNLNIGTGPLKALSAAGTWADFEFNGTAWLLVASGSL